MSCCNKVKCVGYISSCAEGEINLIPDVTGDYTLVYDYASVKQEVAVSLVDGEALTLDGTNFPSNVEIVFQLISSDGEVWQDADGNDCFKLEITPVNVA